MKTIYWSVDKNVDKDGIYPQIQEAADLLTKNELVAIPTETVYGLAGNGKSDEAVEKIFKAKGRPSDNPLIIHIAEQQQLDEFVEQIPEKAQLLMNAFWPGPLTIIFKQKAGVLSQLATAGLGTVAVRMPDHPVALKMIRDAHLPIAAPSANRSGKPSPTIAQHVMEDLEGRIAGVMDGGSTGVGVESTVIDCTSDMPTILRPGGITREQLQEVIGEVDVDRALIDIAEKPKSPGMKYQHYAPDSPLYLVDGTKERIQELINEAKANGQAVGVLTTEEDRLFYDADYVYSCGKRNELETVAAALYDALRSFNKAGVDIIYSEMFPTNGVGHAIMNRLMKAAGHQIVR